MRKEISLGAVLGTSIQRKAHSSRLLLATPVLSAVARATPDAMAGVFERNRIQLQNLARRKAMEKQAAAAREASRAGEAALENGFTVHFNGANREVGRQQQQPLQQQQPARPDTGARVLRVAGALPVQYNNFMEPLPQIELAPRIIARPSTSAEQLPQRRRVRRTWDLGKAVLLKAAGGELLQIDVPVDVQ